jgi:hypothetical protein
VPHAVPPIFVWDPARRDLVAVASLDDASRRVAPWQEVGAMVAYDAEGRRVAFAVESRVTRLLRLWPRRRERVVVADVELEPSHAEDLRRALVTALARRGGDRSLLSLIALGELTARAAAVLR